jgi:signal transduction histidine kinase
MKSNSLRKKTALLITVVILTLFLGIYFYSAQKISEGFLKIEFNEAQTNSLRVDEAVYNYVSIVKSKASDWGRWDDTYEFIENRNEKFIKSNLVSSLVDMDLHTFTFWNNKREMVWGTGLNLLTDKDEEKMYALSKSDFNLISQAEKLHSAKDLSDKKEVFLQMERGPYLLVSVPITNTAGDSPITGHFISGIRLDELFFKDLGDKLRLNIEIIKNHESIDKEILLDLEKNNWHLEVLNSDTLQAYSIIRDFNNNPLIIYKVITPRLIFNQSKKTLNIFLFQMLVAGALLLIIILVALEHLIINRIVKLTDVVKVIKDTGDIKQRVPVIGNDELGDLGHSFNRMLDEVEKLRAVNFHNEKMASLGEMAGGIAHEINNPIMIIAASTNIMKKMLNKGILDQEKYLSQIEDIDKTVLRVSKIISGLKNVSRDSSGEDLVECQLAEVLSDSLAVCYEKFKIHGIKIIVNLEDSNFQQQIKCYRVQLSQVFFNLLGNSFDAIENTSEPWLEITSVTKDKYIYISFKDSGLGISKEIQSKIFQPFYTTKVIGKGTGLGLSLSNSIIQKHNGEFYIDNECKNTCFVIKLPTNEI